MTGAALSVTVDRRPFPRKVFTAAVAAWLAACGAWLGSALGHAPPGAISRAVVLVAIGLTAFLAGRSAWTAVTGRGAVSAGAGRGLVVVLALSLALSLVGLDHEITGRDYGDEGIYRANAERVNEGRLLRPNFIYPHLLYYLDAAALWTADLFPGATEAIASVWGVEGDLATAVLVTRLVTALLAALTVLSVFAIGRRVAGERAGLAGAALLAISPLWVHHGHLNISDVPGAAFATLCLAVVAALLDEERPSLYALAGLAAGLAAGGKYPAGVVAVAVVTVFVRWRLRTRRWGWGLLLAGVVALAVFLLSTPSLLAFPGAVYQGEGSSDLFFGARQYATRGWTGVVKGSNSLYYGQQLGQAFGWPVLLVGSLGLLGLASRERRRLAWLLVFPAVHVALLLGLQMAVPRNLLPVLPALAAGLGCGLEGVWRRVGSRSRWRRVATVALVASLAVPAWATSRELARFALPTTRELAARWIRAELPPGAFLVQEAYTPRVGSPFLSRRPRFASRLAPAELRDPKHDYLMLASDAYGRFLHPQNLEREAYAHHAARYREIFETYPLVKEFRPGFWRGGPRLALYRLDPERVRHRASRRWEAAEAVLPDATMRARDGVRYGRPGQWALFKEYLAAGAWTVRVGGELAGPGRIELRDRVDPAPRAWRLDEDGTSRFQMERPEKVFLYVCAPRGSRLTAVSARRATASEDAE